MATRKKPAAKVAKPKAAQAAYSEPADDGQQTPEQQESQRKYRRYIAEIECYERESARWIERAKKVVKLYKDADNADSTDKARRARFNVLWSNVETLKPALYARDPKPECERRFKDKDPIGRAASEVLERALTYTVSCHGFSPTMRSVVEDRLLPGRGTSWVRYCPTIESESPDAAATGKTPAPPTEAGGAPATAAPEGNSETQVTDDVKPAEYVSYEQAVPDYVFWEDFGHSVARKWEEVDCAWRIVYMDRAALVKRFGEAGQTVQLDYQPRNLDGSTIHDDQKKAKVYELWCKSAGIVCFLTKTHEGLIEERPDPLHLTGFFPCPRPLYATTTNDSLIPVPDYVLYQTQALELEELTARIDNLQKALRLVGVYDSATPALKQLLSGSDNKLIPVDKWAAYAEKGGLKGSIEFLPLKEVAEVLVGLYESRDKVKADLYEITGLADIIRGHSDPRETAKAQQIKGRFAVLRISDTQQEVQRFARDVIRLLAEIIAEHFSLATLRAISGINLPTDAEIQAAVRANPQAAQQLTAQPTWEKVYALLRNGVLREFRVDVETDSMIRTDEEAERAARTEFLTAAGTFVQAVKDAPPVLLPLMGELLMFSIRGYRAGRSMEPMFEEAMDRMKAQAAQPRPDPAQEKVKAELTVAREKAQLDAETERQKQGAQAAQETEKAQMENARAEADAQRTAELERFKAELQAQTDEHKAELERDKAIEIEQIKAENALALETLREENKQLSQERDSARDAASQGQNDDAIENLIAAIRDLRRPRRLVRDETGTLAEIH